MTTTTLTRQATARRTGLMEMVRTWHARARDRRQLAEMTPHQLRDIGLSRAVAGHEARKPFWQA